MQSDIHVREVSQFLVTAITQCSYDTTTVNDIQNNSCVQVTAPMKYCLNSFRFFRGSKEKNTLISQNRRKGMELLQGLRLLILLEMKFLQSVHFRKILQIWSRM